jgi:hypothetical protein
LQPHTRTARTNLRVEEEVIEATIQATHIYLAFVLVPEHTLLVVLWNVLRRVGEFLGPKAILDPL